MQFSAFSCFSGLFIVLCSLLLSLSLPYTQLTAQLANNLCKFCLKQTKSNPEAVQVALLASGKISIEEKLAADYFAVFLGMKQ